MFSTPKMVRYGNGNINPVMKMKYKNSLLLAAYLSCFCFFGSSAIAASKDTLKAASLHPYGRSLQNSNGNLELISSAVHFGFRFTGPYCSIFASLSDPFAHNYLQYTVDDIYHKRIKVSGNSSQA